MTILFTLRVFTRTLHFFHISLWSRYLAWGLTASRLISQHANYQISSNALNPWQKQFVCHIETRNIVYFFVKQISQNLISKTARALKHKTMEAHRLNKIKFEKF